MVDVDKAFMSRIDGNGDYIVCRGRSFPCRRRIGFIGSESATDKSFDSYTDAYN